MESSEGYLMSVWKSKSMKLGSAIGFCFTIPCFLIVAIQIITIKAGLADQSVSTQTGIGLLAATWGQVWIMFGIMASAIISAQNPPTTVVSCLFRSGLNSITWLTLYALGLNAFILIKLKTFFIPVVKFNTDFFVILGISFLYASIMQLVIRRLTRLRS